jgi:hypothetical protein
LGIRNVVAFDILLEEETSMYENVCFHIAGEIYVTVVGGFTDVDMHAEVYCG